MIIKRAQEMGATYAFLSLVRLTGSVRAVFEEKIKAVLPPERVERILNRIKEARGGQMNDTRFDYRMRGEGAYWKSIRDLFRTSQRKFGLTNFPEPPVRSAFRVPKAQMELNLSS